MRIPFSVFVIILFSVVACEKQPSLEEEFERKRGQFIGEWQSNSFIQDYIEDTLYNEFNFAADELFINNDGSFLKVPFLIGSERSGNWYYQYDPEKLILNYDSQTFSNATAYDVMGKSLNLDTIELFASYTINYLIDTTILQIDRQEFTTLIRK